MFLTASLAYFNNTVGTLVPGLELASLICKALSSQVNQYPLKCHKIY